MAELFQFDAKRDAQWPECVACGEMMADAVDELLSDADRLWFDRHVAACVDCSANLADATRGAAWLHLLKVPKPEPSADLLERILWHTSAGLDDQLHPTQPVQPAIIPIHVPTYLPLPTNLLAFRPRMPQLPTMHRVGRLILHPQMAMTAAMAFFSIAITLNLTGVRLDLLHAGNLNPTAIKRSYYQATASAARHYEGLRVVHVLESRVDNLREDVRDTVQSQADDVRGAGGRVPESGRDQTPKAGTHGSGTQETEKPQQEPKGVSRNDAPATAPDLQQPIQSPTAS